MQRQFTQTVGRFLASSFISARIAKAYRRELLLFGRINNWPNPCDLHRQHIIHYAKTKHATLRASSINTYLSIVQSYCSWLECEDLIVVSPFRKLRRHERRLKVPYKVRTFWTVQQFHRVLDKCPDQWRIAALLLVNGVARKTVVERLLISDCDLIEGTIQVTETKTGRQRTSPLHPTVRNELEKYIHSLPANQTQLFTHGFLCEQWYKYCERAGVPKLTLHGLRRLMSTWLQAEGVSIGAVAALLDHKSTSTTYKYYTEVSNEQLRSRAVNALPL